jgi:hypothetical protein
MIVCNYLAGIVFPDQGGSMSKLKPQSFDNQLCGLNIEVPGGIEPPYAVLQTAT